MRRKKSELISDNLTSVSSYTSGEIPMGAFDDIAIAVNATGLPSGTADFTIYHHFTIAGLDAWYPESSPPLSVSALGGHTAKVLGPFTDKIKVQAGGTFAGLSGQVYVVGSAHGIAGG